LLTQAVIVDGNDLIVDRINAVVTAERLENFVDLAAYASKSFIAKPTLGVRLWRKPFVAKASRLRKLAGKFSRGCVLETRGVEVTGSPLESYHNVSVECCAGVQGDDNDIALQVESGGFCETYRSDVAAVAQVG
jgi:hypothetical protein